MKPMSDRRSDRRLLALVLAVSLFSLTALPGVSRAAAGRSPRGISAAEESPLSFVFEWAFRAWRTFAGEAPEAPSHASAPAGIGIDPNGCTGPCAGTTSTTPPGGSTGGL
jgi:hypothetical protein